MGCVEITLPGSLSDDVEAVNFANVRDLICQRTHRMSPSDRILSLTSFHRCVHMLTAAFSSRKYLTRNSDLVVESLKVFKDLLSLYSYKYIFVHTDKLTDI